MNKGISAPLPGRFDSLDPDLVIAAVEQAFGTRLDGSIYPYSSYVNRVYGVRTVDDEELIVKFYRPDRWSTEAIEEEHDFVRECADEELPVVAPIPDEDDATLQVVEIDEPVHAEFAFALFPKRGGRGFDAERDEDWYRLGLLAGRVHTIGRRHTSRHRLVCTPTESTRMFVDRLDAEGVVHPELREEFFGLADEGLRMIEPLFVDVPLQRIHGDFHRGNVLDRADEGLLLIDFDDTMMGPVVQDLWMLLPDRLSEVGREVASLLDGYTEFADFDRSQLRLVEPLRLMRMLYYLAWSALQVSDYTFMRNNPGWGSRAFWLREIEDLRTQIAVINSEDDVPMSDF